MKLYYCQKMAMGDYFGKTVKSTDMKHIPVIQWLVQHIGSMNEIHPNEPISGDGWYFNSDDSMLLSESFRNWVQVEDDIDENLRLEFFLRFYAIADN